MTDRMLVVGTYPPIPLPSAQASLAAVQEGWDGGYEVTAVSPRWSAAHLMVPIAGPLAGRRLENTRRLTSATRVVLVAEPGCPIPMSGWAARWLTLRGLHRALARFEHVTLIRIGDLGLPTGLDQRLAATAHEVRDQPDDGSGVPGVTPLGPPEVEARDRPRLLAVAVARQLLGRYYRPLREAVGRRG